jgi:hypothetical protein
VEVLSDSTADTLSVMLISIPPLWTADESNIRKKRHGVIQLIV